jgi:hypothetical protein
MQIVFGGKGSSTIRCTLQILFLLLLMAGGAFAQRGAVTIPRNLAELTTQSETIVRGKVVSAKVEPHPEFQSLQTVVVTIAVSEALKGDPGQTFTFRQFVWDVRDKLDAAGYHKGDDLLLLMNAPTKYGLSSPAGLGQGRFLIHRDAAGRTIATNEMGNQGLFRGIAPELSKRSVQLSPRLSKVVAQPGAGPLELDDLRGLIRSLVQEKAQ